MQMGLLIDWTTKALCQEGDPDALFVQGAEQNNAKKVCRGCPVRLECLADALDNRIEFGVWGGMTERERRALLRKHADVRSWRGVFEVALEEEQKGGRRRIPVNVNFLPANCEADHRARDGNAVRARFSCLWKTPPHATRRN
jgi:WhiB family redox-sensing transcriptional regulator